MRYKTSQFQSQNALIIEPTVLIRFDGKKKTARILHAGNRIRHENHFPLHSVCKDALTPPHSTRCSVSLLFNVSGLVLVKLFSRRNDRKDGDEEGCG